MWAAISAVAAALEQRVFIRNEKGFLYPNLYTFLVGKPGAGKSTTINAMLNYVKYVNGITLAPTNVTRASLTDAMAKTMTFDTASLFAVPDELSNFMPGRIDKGEDHIGPFLIKAYDNTYYHELKRGRGTDIELHKPQLNLLAGTTPVHLHRLVPAEAWGDGLTSRIILIYGEKQPPIEYKGDWDPSIGRTVDKERKDTELLDDLNHIAKLSGQFRQDPAFINAVNNWAKLGWPEVPTHPQLEYYLPRREGHMFKLAMISSADRSDDLVITTEDFNRATSWLFQAERVMPQVFGEAINAESGAFEKVAYRIREAGAEGVSEPQFIRIIRDYFNANAVGNAKLILISSGQVERFGFDGKTKTWRYRVS